MSADEPDIYPALGIVNVYHQSIVVALDVKDNPAVRYDTGTGEVNFDLPRKTPIGAFHPMEPFSQGWGNIGVPFPILSQPSFGKDTH